ncbi:exodeoxyribonuclease V subunit alpha [Photobacterium galatheae]|nr:exodeoxyribonuclease V subunit alpha [Photobacterium galatheae]MCM0149020.1 exodeoxyribonuclease V subunit alpha [Photobacterium galatheae]
MKNMTDLIQNLYQEKIIRPLDLQFSKQIRSLCSMNLSPIELDFITYIAVTTSYEYSLSHICVPLNKMKKKHVFGLKKYPEKLNSFLPRTEEWEIILDKSGVCSDGTRVTPLVFDGERIYIYRNWLMEKEVAEKLFELSKPKTLDETRLSKINITLNQLFPREYQLFDQFTSQIGDDTSDDDIFSLVCDLLHVKEENIQKINKIAVLQAMKNRNREDISQKMNTLIPESLCVNWQKVSTAVALTRQLSVITGGPGTGKTTTVSKLLAALAEIHKSQDFTIKLCAPTGKAAARLTESISRAIEKLTISKQVKKRIPSEASTIHRLLGSFNKKADFRYHRSNKLHLDVLVVDEASMIDLALMSKLLEALPDEAILILLGDKDQLASVEAGAVFGDICQFIKRGVSESQKNILDLITHYSIPYERDSNDFSDSLCLLRKSYRFHQNSGIGQLAFSTNTGDPHLINQVISNEYEDINVIELNPESYRLFLKDVANAYTGYLNMILNGEDKQEVLKSFSQVRLLCATRDGECGIKATNKKIEMLLESGGFISRPKTSSWYVGRPVMITKNAHAFNLYNGDIGICMRDIDEKLYVYFESPHGGLRKFLPSRLPDHETIFGMTIHKSQGSEFKKTYLLLPEKMSAMMTRELVYTGITRAKESLTICCLRKILHKSSAFKTKRNSGLVALLSS